MFKNKIYYKQVLDEWLINKEKIIKISTFYKYQTVIEGNIKPILGNIAFKKIKSEDIFNFFENEKTIYLSNSTKKLLLIIINSSIKYGIEKNIENLFLF